jgi:hypothetical protein
MFDCTQEFTMLQMVLTAKQIMFAYNYADGWLLKNGKASLIILTHSSYCTCHTL